MVMGCVCGLHARSLPSANEVTVLTAVEVFHLTPRELEVAQLLVRGDSNKQIAAALVITSSTARAHIEAIFDKTKADNRTRAAWLLTPYIGRNL